MIAKKVACVLTNPHCRLILCVGEELGIREANKQDAFVSKQLCGAFSRISSSDKIDFKNVAIAYEPVWAIGTGKTASEVEVGTRAKYYR